MATIVQDTKPLDARVDQVFGEPILLKPMKTAGGGYRESMPDDSRQEVIGVGIYDQGRGAVEPTGQGMVHRQATTDTTLSLRFEIVDRAQLRKGDRVFFPERQEWYEVTYISPDPGGRPDVHLVRVLEDQINP
jgi:hypothetical protein